MAFQCGLFQLSFSSGVPVYPASIRWVAQWYPSVHWVNQWHSIGIPVYTGPASVHWVRVRVVNVPHSGTVTISRVHFKLTKTHKNIYFTVGQALLCLLYFGEYWSFYYDGTALFMLPVQYWPKVYPVPVDDWIRWQLPISGLLALWSTGKSWQLAVNGCVYWKYMLHSADRSIKLSGTRRTQTQTSEVRWAARSSGH